MNTPETTKEELEEIRFQLARMENMLKTIVASLNDLNPQRQSFGG